MKHFIKVGSIILILVILVGVIVWQFQAVKFLSKRIYFPPSPSSYYYDDAGNGKFGGSVSAKGTWQSNLELTYPYNINEVNCWRKWNSCIVAQAYITGVEGILQTNVLNTDVIYFEIESWDNNKIVARNFPEAYAETILTVDRTLEKITTITTSVYTGEVQTNILVDGSEKWRNEFISNKEAVAK